jgi:uncharacterized membrane protein
MSDIRTFSTRRVEALTDGVFAIAMTLLVLDLHVDALGAVHSSGDLWRALTDIKSSILSFVVSFLLLGSMWAVHARQFEFIKRADRTLITINTFRLLAVVFIPLTTSIAGNYTDTVLGRVLFPVNFFLLAAVSYYEWCYAVSPAHDFASGLSKSDKAYLAVRNQAIVALSFLVIFVAAVVGEVAFVLFLLTPLLGRSRLQRPATRDA